MTADSFYLLTAFLTTGTDFFAAFRVTFDRSLSIRHYTGYVIIGIYKYMNKLQF